MTGRSWEVEPGVGVGPLRFGTARTELHASVGRHRAFRRSAWSAELTDWYEDSAVMLTCSAADGLYLVEVPEGAGLSLRGVPLSGRLRQVLVELHAAGVEVTADEAGTGTGSDGTWIVAGGAVTLWSPSAGRAAAVEAVAVLGPGHEARGQVLFFPPGVEAGERAEVDRGIRPGVGVGVVTLGLPRDAVRERLHEGTFWRHAPGSREPVQDHFFADGLVVEYDADLRARRIAVTHPTARETPRPATLAGIDLLPDYPATLDDVVAALAAAGHTATAGEAAVAIGDAGVTLWAGRPLADGPQGILAVIVEA